MKKVKMLLTMLLLLAFFVCAVASGETTTNDQGVESVSQDVEVVEQEEEATDAIGDYSLVIDSCRLASDYEGKDVIIVKYIFTNVSADEAAAFAWTFDAAAYQDGVGLNESYFVDDSADYNMDDQSKEIKAGATLEVEVAYELNDTTTDVEVEVTELFSFDDTMITKTFQIAE